MNHETNALHQELPVDPTNHTPSISLLISKIQELQNQINNQGSYTPEWMNLKEGAAYAGVSYNTFMKFRVQGLSICEIDGIKRVSKTEIDNFLNEHSY